MSSTPPGWYPDGSPQNATRYWDGQAWTESVQPVPILQQPVRTEYVFNFGSGQNDAADQEWLERNRAYNEPGVVHLTPAQGRKAMPFLALISGIVLVFFGLVGLGFVTLTSTVFSGFNQPPEGSVETTALVVDLVFDSDGNCSPVLEFVEETESATVTAPLGATPCQWATGDTVVAYYVPGQLQQTGTTLFTSDTSTDSVLGSFSLINPIIILVGVALIIFSVWLFRANRRNAAA